jgi:hypothetical protein
MRQQGHYALDRDLRFFAQHCVVVVCDRVLDDGERVARQAVQFTHHLRAANEAVGDDRDGRDPQPLRFDGVMQTA